MKNVVVEEIRAYLGQGGHGGSALRLVAGHAGVPGGQSELRDRLDRGRPRQEALPCSLLHRRKVRDATGDRPELPQYPPVPLRAGKIHVIDIQFLWSLIFPPAGLVCTLYSDTAATGEQAGAERGAAARQDPPAARAQQLHREQLLVPPPTPQVPGLALLSHS